VAKPPIVVVREAAPILGPDGFLTVESLRALVSQSGLLDEGENVRKELLIFQTPKQRTWLLATEKFLLIMLDDERTRSRKNLIQTFFEKTRTFPLKFGSEGDAGIVKFGAEETWWYFSFQLFPTVARLRKAVERLVS